MEMLDQMSQGKKRELKRNNELLREFDASSDPNLLVLYHHLRDKEFDCFNAKEYTNQMIAYHQKNIKLVEVVSRKMNGHDYFLVCCRHEIEQNNPLCELAFQVQRQMQGYCMLVKKRCFHCHTNENVKMCSGCQCACFCSTACLKKHWGIHKPFCKLVDPKSITLDKEAFTVDT